MNPRRGIWTPRNPVLYLLPLLLYTLLAVTPHGLDTSSLLLRYSLQVAVTIAALCLAWPALGQLNWSLPRLTWPIAIAGSLLWIVLAAQQWEWQALEWLGLAQWRSTAARPQFNPLDAFDGHETAYYGFLLIRSLGLVAVVPLAEELMLRGFLLRFLSAPNWSEKSIGDLEWIAWLAAPAYGIASHPAEPLAAAAWFSLITLLAYKTRSFAACVAAHATANALLLAYILITHDWRLW